MKNFDFLSKKKIFFQRQTLSNPSSKILSSGLDVDLNFLINASKPYQARCKQKIEFKELDSKIKKFKKKKKFLFLEWKI